MPVSTKRMLATLYVAVAFAFAYGASPIVWAIMTIAYVATFVPQIREGN